MMYLSQPRNAHARSVVIFIPHAGGSGESYMPWFRRFSNKVDCRYLQLPARGRRMNETMPDSIDCLTDLILEELHSISDKQIILFGHSMGGIIAFDLVLKMEKIWHKPIYALFISSCRAPCEPLKYHFSGLDDEEFIRKLVEMEGIDASLINNQEILQLFLPTLRHDIALCENYIDPLPKPLQTPLHIIWGTEDHFITNKMIYSWRKFALEGNIHFYPHHGGHFYHHSQFKNVVSIIQQTI